jgi:FtsP/CotA-like multicopper oxidase with cupredoxin domain
MTVITSDFVPIKPYTTSSISINIGQRYDVIINANQAVGNYWLRADVATQCGRNRTPNGIKSIIRYEGAPEVEPTTQNTVTKSTACYDESVVPYAPNTVPKADFRNAMSNLVMDFNLSTVNGPLVQWLINGSDIRVDWSKPTLQYVQDGNYTFEKRMNVFEINQRDQWVFWYIQTVAGDQINIPHPMHLHVSPILHALSGMSLTLYRVMVSLLLSYHDRQFLRATYACRNYANMSLQITTSLVKALVSGMAARLDSSSITHLDVTPRFSPQEAG